MLVIDDQRICRVTAARTLESFGLRVLEAADGVEGLRLAREHRPKMVLTDALMPKLDGRELCRLVKQDPLLAGTQVAVMTSLYTSPSQRNEGMQVFRADAWLAKPVDAAKLREVVTRLVGPG